MTNHELSEQEIVRRAQQKAVEILGTAQNQSKEISRSVTVYCEDTLKNTEEALARSINDVKNTRLNLRNAASRSAGRRKQQ